MKQRIIVFWLCFFYSSYIAYAQMNYITKQIFGNVYTYGFPEKKKDGYYRFCFIEGYVLASYRDSMPEGVWTYYTYDSIIKHVSFFSKGEILFGQEYKDGELKRETIYEYPFNPLLDYETDEGQVVNLEAISLTGEKMGIIHLKKMDASAGVFKDPPELLIRHYKEGRVVEFYKPYEHINYEQIELPENYAFNTWFPEIKKDGYYCLNFSNGFVLASYKDIMPEGVWTYYSKDSIIQSASYFSRGELLFKQYYRGGKLAADKILEYPLLDSEASEKIEKEIAEGFFPFSFNSLVNYKLLIINASCCSPKVLIRKEYDASGKIKSNE